MRTTALDVKYPFTYALDAIRDLREQLNRAARLVFDDSATRSFGEHPVSQHPTV